MRMRKRVLLSLGSLLLALVAAAGLALLLPPSVAFAQGGSILPPDTCTLQPDGITRTCELWARPDTLTLPDGEVVNVWRIADTATGPVPASASLIVADAGETLEVILHNELPGETVSLTFPGQMGLMPDLAGVATGGTVTYSFVLNQPGTFLYEAGMTPNGLRQVVMGLYGALVVRPTGAPSQAYDDPATTFHDEALVVLGAIDPAFNADPNNFSMQFYRPEYWLINGRAYSETVPISTTSGNDLLLRYINATHETQGMGILGLRQRVIGSDGRPLSYPYGVVNETIASGQTLDTLITIPAGTPIDTLYPLYNTAFLLHNSSHRDPVDGSLTYGGMMTFIKTITGAPGSLDGPTVSAVTVEPSPTTGTLGVTLTFTLTDALSGGSNVVAAEWFTGSLGAEGSGMAILPDTPAVQVVVSTTIPSTTLSTWPSGPTTFFVRGQDFEGNWGPPGSAVLDLDKLGPDVTGLSLSVNPTNGTRDVLLRATGDDRSNGGQDVVAGAYLIDGGASRPMWLARIDAPVVAMTATISTTLQSTLTEGVHSIDVTAQDFLGNWGAPGSIDLSVDLTGPLEAALTLTPNTLNLTGPPPVTHVRMEGSITDTLAAGVQSPLANAEAFIDRTGPAGTGFAIFPSDGLFDEVAERVYFDIPITAFLWLSQGEHTVYAHGLDVAGNWGELGGAIMMIDRGTTDTTGPDITTMAVSPNPTGGAAWATLTGYASDPQALSNVDAAEYYVGADPGLGNAVAVQPQDGAYDSTVEVLTQQIQTGLWADGTHQVHLRARDSAANWGPYTSIALEVSGNGALIMADGFGAGDLDQWTEAVGAVDVTSDAAIDQSGDAMGLQADIGGGAAAFASVAMPAGETDYQASFYFDPNGADMGAGYHDILSGLYLGAPIFGIQVEKAGAGYQVRAWALSRGVPLQTGWHGISDGPHKLGIKWEAGTASEISLSVDGAVVQKLGSLDTSAYQVYEVRLGPSANLDLAASGVEYFDSFESRRALRFYLPIIFRGQ